MALPIPGPIGARAPRADRPSAARRAAGAAAPPPAPGYGTLSSAQLFGGARPGEGAIARDRGRSQDVRGSVVATWMAIFAFASIVAVTVIEGIRDGFSIWDWGVIGLSVLGLLIVAAAAVIAVARR